MTEAEVLQIFKDAGAYLEGHFLLTSGKHSGHYVEKFQVLQYPELTEKLCGELAARFQGQNIQTVVGPATGGIILSQLVARKLGARALFTERENGQMALRLGFQIQPGERVLVVEDIVTTGGSVHEVLAVLSELEADVVGVGLLVDRSGGKANFNLPTEALLHLSIPVYEPSDCPLCKNGIPLTQRGSRYLKGGKS
ncbi:MAG TPA: orotate phosphoribosyltransferase [Bacillota bacterium]|nr:orotate phosphoribosyltransferase [Bacillota bacterium]